MRVVEALRTVAGFMAPFAALLLLPAGLTRGGDWTWVRGWILLAVIGAVVTVGYVALAVWRPDSFRVRRQGVVGRAEQKQPWLDAVGSVIYFGWLVGWTAFIPLDVFTLKLLPQPSGPLSALGLAGCVAGLAIGQVAVAQNRFASPIVQSQAGQQVIDRGVYGVVRHPLYAGNLLAFAGMALWLGSTAAACAVVVMLAFTFARIGLEERQLRADLPGYADYAARVRSRLIPFLL
jgi:protein-S-isoprenylcysteine O-methyltransferase Ste14